MRHATTQYSFDSTITRKYAKKDQESKKEHTCGSNLGYQIPEKSVDLFEARVL